MDRQERKPVLEPIMLILKQRTGVATILGIIVSVVLKYFDFPNETIAMVVALIITYVGKQTYLDAKEASTPILDFGDKLNDLLETKETNKSNE